MTVIAWDGKTLAAEFGVNAKTIYSVKAGLTWWEHAPNSSVFNFARSA